jgi:hypothetical protein
MADDTPDVADGDSGEAASQLDSETSVPVHHFQSLDAPEFRHDGRAGDQRVQRSNGESTTLETSPYPSHTARASAGPKGRIVSRDNSSSSWA